MERTTLIQSICPKHIPHSLRFHLLDGRRYVFIENAIPSCQGRHIKRASHLKRYIHTRPSRLQEELSSLCMCPKPAQLLVCLGSSGEPPSWKFPSRVRQSVLNLNLANG